MCPLFRETTAFFKSKLIRKLYTLINTIKIDWIKPKARNAKKWLLSKNVVKYSALYNNEQVVWIIQKILYCANGKPVDRWNSQFNDNDTWEILDENQNSEHGFQYTRCQYDTQDRLIKTWSQDPWRSKVWTHLVYMLAIARRIADGLAWPYKKSIRFQHVFFANFFHAKQICSFLPISYLN